MKKRLLELGGCEGASTVGYQRAGWHVTAVDIDANRLKYNPADAVIVADAFDVLDSVARTGYYQGYGPFDAAHESAPCQWYTAGRRAHRGKASKWERTIPPWREAVQATGLPYVIENVKDAGWDMREPVLLCGCMFDLSVRDYSCTSPGEHIGTCDTAKGVLVHLQRPRLFETSGWKLTAPRKCEGEGQPRNVHPSQEWVAGSYGGARRDKFEARYIRKGGYVPPGMDIVRALLGIDHRMTWQGLHEAIPPAYTEWVGHQLATYVESEVAA